MGKLKKDNFTNRYFKPDLLQKQIDLIKEPTSTDAMAESFQKYKDLPSSNAHAQMDNMTMGAIGDGIKSVANDQRQEKLSPVLEMVGQLNARSAYLEAQWQEHQQQEMETQQFVQNQSFAFLELSKAVSAGDSTAANNIARGILQSYKSMSGDPIVGDFDHYYDGNIYYTNTETGAKEALSIPLLLNQSGIAQELFGTEYPTMMSSFSTGFAAQYKNEQEMQRLALEKERAGIRNTNAQANQHDANTQYLGMQSRQIEDQMNTPAPKYDDGTLSHIRKGNSDWVNELNKKHKDAKKAIKAQIQIRDAIQEELNNGSSQIGSSVLAQAARWFNEKDGDNRAQQLIELKRQPLFKDLKNTFGARITDNDLATWLTTQVDLNTQPELAIEVLNERIQDAESDVQEELLRRAILEMEFQNNEPYNSMLVDDRVQEEMHNIMQSMQEEQNLNMSTNESQEDMIKATDPETGESMMIPMEQAQEAQSRGLVIEQ